MNKFFITTAIDYVNASPHLGHALEKIQTDVLARYHRLLGDKVLFLTGTDENSLKNVQAAKKEVTSVEAVVNRNAHKFYELKRVLNLTFDDFIRTTEERHIKGVQKLWSRCKKDIYERTYKGLYCVECEEFYKENELKDGLCPEHSVKPELIEEKNYFFRLSKYQNELKQKIEEDEIKIIPTTRKNEALSFINQGLEDICISRSAERAQGWGIDVLGDKTQKVWVWFDALSNYINAIGYADNEKKFKKWWPADLHIIGKGILRFHAVYWPAILLSAKLLLPKRIFVHGYLTVRGKKMSKSLGNVIDPFGLVKEYGTDAVRYFLLREIPATEDGDFTYEKFKERYNADLANGIGNTVNRVLTMIEKYFNGNIPEYELISLIKQEGIRENKIVDVNNLRDSIFREQIRPSLTWFSDGFYFNFYLDTIINGFQKIDESIEEAKPWNSDSIIVQRDFKRDFYTWLECIRWLATLLYPFLPSTSEKIFEKLGLESKKELKKPFEELIKWGRLKDGTETKQGKPLFPRI